jgi:hypothetical protein
MTLRDVSYSILEIVRNSNIVDDERIDIRLIDNFVNQKRAELLSINKTSAGNELLSQSTTIKVVSENNSLPNPILKSVLPVPNFINNAYGPLVYEIKGTFSTSLPFIFVPFDRLRWSGNGFMNQNNIFASIDDNYLYIKSKNSSFKMLEDISISGVFEDPLSVLDINGDPLITVDSGRYPINGELFNTIKNLVIKESLMVMLKTNSDEINDSSGLIHN